MDVNSKPIGLAVLLLLLLVGLQLRRGGSSTVFHCIEEEREALLGFKSGLVDTGNHLSSWVVEDDECCRWEGVRCNNRTGRVERLHLRGSQLEGEIRPSLLDLTHLKHLDLSLNNFSEIPVFLGSFKELRYLNLSEAILLGKVPPELGNLSTLQHLDLSNNFIEVKETQWLSRLTSLEHLDMSSVMFREVSSSSHNWLHALNMLPSILEIRLSDCDLDGALPSSLHHHNNFTSLSILDLSSNYINSTIPKWLCNLTTLSYLNLSNNLFYGHIPASLGNMTSLKYLDLNENSINSTIHEWLCNLTSLSYLNLNWNQFYGHIPACIGSMTSLEYLDLMENNINSTITGWLCNLTSLSYLDLSYNQFYGHIPACLGDMTSLKYLDLTLNSINSTIPEWLCSLTSLSHLDLSYNQFYGPIPAALGNMTSLEYLDLSSNDYIDGEIPKTLANLCNLSTFSLSRNLGVSGFLDELQEVFTGCMSNNLETLDLSFTNLTGRLPDWLGGLVSLQALNLHYNELTGHIPKTLGRRLSNLTNLDLGNNNLNGSIPKTLGRLSSLTQLDLGNNKLEGIMTEEHFMNLANLKYIDISGNPSLALKVSRGWNPPFRLDYIYMSSCLLGPQFPAWLRTQENYVDLQMSNAAIFDTIPDWLWNLSTQFETLDLSHNKIGGKLQIPTSDSAGTLDLSDNLFSGPIPPSMWEAMPLFLSLATNSINGTIPSSICKATMLETLDLSNNFLSGELPKCWEKLMSLEALNLSNNKLSGGLPSSICMPNSLKSLHLGSNILSGELFSLSNCSELAELNLSRNRFNGSIPPWIGQKLSSLKILSLHSNKLSGSIPSQLSNLAALQILDLSHNQLSGFIPKSFGNFTAMKFKHNIGDWTIDPLINTESMMLSMKGRYLQYDLLLLSIVVTIDLSNNQLYGSVPKEVGKLIELVNLNLSGNQLSGEIIKEFGQLQQLETLDLSNNKFSGRIPSSLSNIYSLSNLNLSYNNLTGRIPSGDQLQTFGPSNYIGNDDLCGLPLIKKCPSDETPPTIWDGSSTYEETEGSDDIVWIYSGMTPGFVVGLLAFFGLLALKMKWRIAYFRFIDYIYDTIYVAIVINIKKLKRGMPKIVNHGLARRN